MTKIPYKKLPYENQEHAALQILQSYNGTLRYGLLRANEQSGKTSTYHYLIRLMFEQKLIDRVYILCGSNDIDLLSQCNKDVDEWDVDEWNNRLNVEVVFRQHFNKLRMTTNRALIIVDESHLVEGVNQSLSRFIRDHGLTMAGTNEKMIRDNTYILSVDATPYAEESAIATNQSHPKFKVTLADGHGYFGVKEYLESGLVRPTFELNTVRGRNNFTLLLQKYNQKYILVRIQEKRNKSVKWMKQYAELAGCDIKHFTSHFMKNKSQICITKDEAEAHFEKYGKTIPCLEEEPERTTIVFIDGRLRCGKRVPKLYIGFIWEASKSANTDVIRQSLFGRMCGYIGNGLYNVSDEKPLIFIPGHILKPQNNKVILFSDLDRTIWRNPSNETLLTPRFANNLIPGRIQNIAKRDGEQVTPCVPIRFTIPPPSSENDDTLKSICYSKLLDNPHLITGNRCLTQEQKDAVTKKLAKYQKKIFFSKINYAALAPISKLVVKDIQKVLIVSGIANPMAMLNHLSAIYSTEHINFSDHHEFSQKDIDLIHKKFDTFANKNTIIVTTHKDFMRLKNVLSELHLENYPWYILPMTVTIENENEFNQLIRNYVRKI